MFDFVGLFDYLLEYTHRYRYVLIHVLRKNVCRDKHQNVSPSHLCRVGLGCFHLFCFLEFSNSLALAFITYVTIKALKLSTKVCFKQEPQS